MRVTKHTNWAEAGITVTRDDKSTLDMTFLKGDTANPTELHIALYTPEAQQSGDATQELALTLVEARELYSTLTLPEVRALLGGPEPAA